MEINNNSVLYPNKCDLKNDEPITPKILKPLIERVNALEGTVKNYEDEFRTDNLYADYAKVNRLEYDYVVPGGGIAPESLITPEAEIGELTITDSIKGTDDTINVTSKMKLSNLETDTPILSNRLVGYDSNHKLIPVESPNAVAYYPYVVDTQTKFNNLMTMAKSQSIEYDSIAIIGGLGGGTNGEYTLTVDTDTTSLYFENIKLVGYGDVKIDITSDNPNTVTLFYYGTFENISFNAHGTISSDKTLTLIKSATLENCSVTSSSLDFEIYGNTMKNCNLKEIKTLQFCNLEDCDDTSSSLIPNYRFCNLDKCKVYETVFYECLSPLTYTRSSVDTTRKYQFSYCTMHLDIFSNDSRYATTVDLRIASLTYSNLSMLSKDDLYRGYKLFQVTVDSADVNSNIIGNNDNVYSAYKNIAQKVSKSISLNNRSKAYLCIYDKSYTPIFSYNGTNFYADENMTIPVSVWSANGSDSNFVYVGFKKGDNYYSDLEFSKCYFDVGSSGSESTVVIKLTDFLCDEWTVNNVRMKEYFELGDESRTILYSDDNGSNMYLTPDKNANFKVRKYDNTIDSGTVHINTYRLGEGNIYASSMNFNNSCRGTLGNTKSFDTVEVPSYKNSYNVKITSPHNVPLFVQNAWYTKNKTV